MAESGGLPRWGGVTEPVTVLTNVILGLAAFVFASRLAYHSAVEGSASGGLMAAALLATAFAAFLGAMAHGIDPVTEPALRARFWHGALYTTGFISAATLASVALFATTGGLRAAILAFAAVKLVVYLVRVARRPEFRVAAADYGGALAVLFAAAVFGALRWRMSGASWLIGAVLVSLAAGVAQARRIGFHRHFNHNDFYHVIQLVALYAFYRGGALLVDR